MQKMPGSSPALPPDDLVNLAKALEGMAGALHDCRPVAQEDMEVIAQVAHDAWPVRGVPKDSYDQEFESARAEIRRFAAAAASGDARAVSGIEKAALHMANALRWKAKQECVPVRLPRGHHPRRVIHTLDKRYARFAHRQAAAPMIG
ncbi:MAG: hypothetical protein QOD77_1870 [Thermoplasmata archaeon]|jgi:hypothetical protein|nr:hypothetical protein [Thermoplasmata archaeon]